VSPEDEGDQMEKDSSQLAGEDIARYHFFRSVQDESLRWRSPPSEDAAAIARNVLREELGYFGEYKGPHYTLTEPEKNILLTHGRQDAAIAAVAALRTGLRHTD
jgi:hypothetical protein